MYLPSLHQRAALAINCLTEHCDAARGYLPYFYTRLSDRPPSTVLTIWSYGDGLGRSVDALTLLRAMTGESVDQEPDRAMRDTLIGLLGVDGLSWCPAEPWTMPVPHTRPAWLQQGTLLGLTSLWLFTGDDAYRQLAERNIAAVAALAVPHPDGYATFPGDHYTRRDGWQSHDDPMHRRSVFATSVTMPLMRFYRHTGYEPALTLAGDLLGWALADHADGEKIFDIGHFHCQSRLVTALLLKGICTGNRDDLELGEALYRKGRALGTASGWFPEQINNPEHNRSNLSETCCLTDMLEAAILLGEHVDVAYWHDAERFAKNHLLVHQLIDSDWFGQLTYVPREQHVLGFNYENREGDDGTVSHERFRQTLLGAFAGWGAVTAMSDDSMFANSNQHCCNAAGARALYDAWKYAVSDDGQTFRVNLHLDRRHAAGDVRVHEGETATLTLHLRAAREVAVRIPEFVTAEEMVVTGHGHPRPVRAVNGYLHLGHLAAGEEVSIRYPQPAHTTTETIAPGTFTFHWRGASVVEAEPVQAMRPLFTPERFLAHPPEHGPIPTLEPQSL